LDVHLLIFVSSECFVVEYLKHRAPKSKPCHNDVLFVRWGRDLALSIDVVEHWLDANINQLFNSWHIDFLILFVAGEELRKVCLPAED
jgi:hypothetical protein